MTVRQAVLDSIVAHARRAAPNECCGLLIACDGCIEEAAPVRNVRESPTRYQLDPAEHFTNIRRVRQEGRAIVGAYHSHPSSSAIPSPTDVAEAFDEEFLHVIVSLQNPAAVDIRGYRIAKGNFHEVRLVTVP